VPGWFDHSAFTVQRASREIVRSGSDRKDATAGGVLQGSWGK
jgi:hypothetical protein